MCWVWKCVRWQWRYKLFFRNDEFMLHCNFPHFPLILALFRFVGNFLDAVSRTKFSSFKKVTKKIGDTRLPASKYFVFMTFPEDWKSLITVGHTNDTYHLFKLIWCSVESLLRWKRKFYTNQLLTQMIFLVQKNPRRFSEKHKFSV